MKQEILSQLYNDAVINDRAYKELIDNDEYDKARERSSEIREELFNSFNDGQKQLFDMFYDNLLKICDHEEEAIFKYGVALGIRMTSEAFVITEKTIEE